MSNLFSNQSVKQVTIEGEYWVKIKERSSVEEMEAFFNLGEKMKAGEMTAIEVTIKSMPIFVTEWNFKESDDGPVLPLEESQIKKLNFEILRKIQDLMKDVNQELKKIYDELEVANEKNKKKGLTVS